MLSQAHENHRVYKVWMAALGRRIVPKTIREYFMPRQKIFFALVI